MAAPQIPQVGINILFKTIFIMRPVAADNKLYFGIFLYTKYALIGIVNETKKMPATNKYNIG